MSNLNYLIEELSQMSEILTVPLLLYEKALPLVDEKYILDFFRFVETGEANQIFLDYLDTDPNAEKAVDIIFQAQARAFEDLARKLRK